MLGIQINTRFDRNIVNYMAKKLTDSTNTATYQTAIDIAEDVQANWSSDSPSSPGQPPAVVTAKLSDSVKIEDISTGTKSVYVLTFNSGYDQALEYGTPTMAARPFLSVAVMRNRGIYMKNMKLAMK